MASFIQPWIAQLLLVSLIFGCRDNGNKSDDDNNVGYFEGDPEAVDPDCTGVRLTTYGASNGGWCEFDRTLDILPASVRDGMTFAIAEPWNGGSYDGESGEACGECWEVDTINATQIVMVHDLCPIEGNPLCSGGYFHFDLASEAGAALGGGGLDAATARRVPCPVEGNVHAQINDANEWGYLRLAFVNHRIPIRTAQVRALPDGDWRDMERSGGAWHIVEGPTADDGDGIGFLLTAPTGETVESTTTLAVNPSKGTVHDLGVQFADPGVLEGECRFIPPGDVYVDAYGGIEGVTWAPNPWGDGASVEETSDGCADGSASCLRVRLGQWAGAHLYYRQPFPTDTFETLSFSLFGLTSPNDIVIAPSSDGERCVETSVAIVENDWTEITVTLADACSAVPNLNGVTFSCNSEGCEFLMDDIIYR